MGMNVTFGSSMDGWMNTWMDAPRYFIVVMHRAVISQMRFSDRQGREQPLHLCRRMQHGGTSQLCSNMGVLDVALEFTLCSYRGKSKAVGVKFEVVISACSQAGIVHKRVVEVLRIY